MAKRKAPSVKTLDLRIKPTSAPAPKPQPDPTPVPEEDAQDILELEDFQDDPHNPDSGQHAAVATWHRAPFWARALGSLVVFAVLAVASFELVYAGKVFPGVTANGADLGGHSLKGSQALLEDKATQFNQQVITITDGDTNLRIPVISLAPQYGAARAAQLAYHYGREGSLTNRARQQLRALLGRATNFSVYSYNDARLIPYVVGLDDDLITPVQNASLNFNDSHAQVTPAQTGTRLDLGRLTQLVNERLAQTSVEPIHAPVYQLQPDLGTEPLQAAVRQIDGYVSGPIPLTYNGIERQIDQKTIISWIQVGAKLNKPFLQTLKLDDLYPPSAAADLGLSNAAVQAYVADLARGIDQTAQNAGLAMQDGHLAVVQPSRTGAKLDQPAAVTAILAALKQPSNQRTTTLKLATTAAEVNENNLESLGIKEQISEGETYFPGSPSTRLTNVRAGANRFNGVLLKPGEVFSFGKLLGAVGPETGYVPELVILGDHEEKQYGGGLCQVSSTAFRAALAAGLPILERVNHAFAISYYTWPYSAPGVDATIYYPAVDFKFKNDTGSYILMQTIMKGTDLKFEFFGTKTKTGVLRGPDFVTGNSDPTQPSHTVFYRDVLDLTGAVTKTDTFNTYYKSSKDFPITKQFN
ncbi:MAG: VanW family protein [Patescibacteria group bacterium]|nr:VanW family protein [Patescibacteria group bacterium]